MTEFANNYEKLFYGALRIRMVEEKIIELYPSDLIQSPVHLSIGQEAVAVGLCENLSPNDWVFINYRGHAFYLSKGGNLSGFFAELMGRKTGISGGKAGSMHLAAPEVGIIGASAVVASTISHAVGAALAAKIQGIDRVCVANFGDGALEEGVFYESLNFAALHQVPILFLCEDNDLAIHSPKQERQAFNLEKLINAFSIPYVKIEEGYDFEKIAKTSSFVINNIKKNKSPAFLHIKTARYYEHVGPGLDFAFGYRSEDQIQAWKKLDPIDSDIKLINKFSGRIKNEIDYAVDFAINSPYPSAGDLDKDVL
jgi:TPP-dependent pyruvate/acetoin dehydrogenase alpha subunit